MEVNMRMGASLSVISETSTHKLWPALDTLNSDMKLTMCTGEDIPMAGVISVKVCGQRKWT